VLHAQEPLLHAAARGRGADLIRETREELAAFTQATVSPGGGPVTHHVVVGPPVDVVCDRARREQVDVLVVGLHGMSGAAHALFGSTAEGVLVRSNISVLAVPGSWAPPDPTGTDLAGTGPLVAAIECSTPALLAAAAACRLARVLQTSVEAVHVVPAIGVLARWQAHADTAIDRRLDEARRELTPLLPQLHSEVPVRLQVESGDVVDRLVAATDRCGPHTVLVLGRRSPGARQGAPGAVARRVLAQARVPVLVYLAET
jgi:nucleotide-binding universal stress UspA family protein